VATQSLSAAAAATAAAAGAPGLAGAGHLALPALLNSLGAFIASCAGAMFVLAAVPALFALAKLALRAESVLRVSGRCGWGGRVWRVCEGGHRDTYELRARQQQQQWAARLTLVAAICCFPPSHRS
jgi:hypothetical protein